MTNVYVTAYVTTQIYEYDLASGSYQYFGKLSNKAIYKFYIDIEYGQKVDIVFTKSDSSSTTYQNITIYAYPFKSSNYELIKENYSLSYNPTENSYTKSYKVYSYSTKYLAFEIIPFYEMTSVYISVTVKEISTTKEDKNNINFSNILIPILIVVIFIVLIAFCYIRNRKKKKIDFQNPSIQPLYPINYQNANHIPPY